MKKLINTVGSLFLPKSEKSIRYKKAKNFKLVISISIFAKEKI